MHPLKGRRRLSITSSGRWYIAFTILIGVTALVSGNNTIYLVESLLLSGLILSGVLSEHIISGVRLRIQRRSVSAGEQSPERDTIHLSNQSRQALYCIEIGEWTRGRFERILFVPVLPAKATVSFPSEQIFSNRGIHRWEALAIGTLYPFGFAKKIRIIHAPGERIVWPTRKNTPYSLSQTDLMRSSPREMVTIEGEVRQMAHGDDYRQIVWTLSSRDQGYYVRMRRSETPEVTVRLDLRTAPGPAFENAVIEAAAPFYSAKEGSGISLLLIGQDARRRIHGKKAALNALAEVRPT